MSGGESRNRTGVDGFAIRCITTLLSRHKEKSCFKNNLILNGAGNESRTRDLNLGKVALYQLSYSRIIKNTVFFGAGNESRTRDLNLGKVALYQLSYSRVNRIFLNCGAGNESRTRDLNLGKVALYQLSYSRILEVFAGSKEAAIIAASLRLSSIVSEFI